MCLYLSVGGTQCPGLISPFSHPQAYSSPQDTTGQVISYRNHCSPKQESRMYAFCHAPVFTHACSCAGRTHLVLPMLILWAHQAKLPHPPIQLYHQLVKLRSDSILPSCAYSQLDREGLAATSLQTSSTLIPMECTTADMAGYASVKVQQDTPTTSWKGLSSMHHSLSKRTYNFHRTTHLLPSTLCKASC